MCTLRVPCSYCRIHHAIWKDLGITSLRRKQTNKQKTCCSTVLNPTWQEPDSFLVMLREFQCWGEICKWSPKHFFSNYIIFILKSVFLKILTKIITNIIQIIKVLLLNYILKKCKACIAHFNVLIIKAFLLVEI